MKFCIGLIVHELMEYLVAAEQPFEFEFEGDNVNEQNVRDLVYEEMLYFHPPECSTDMDPSQDL